MKTLFQILIINLLFFLTQELFTQTIDFKWAAKAGGQFTDGSTDVATDISGNIIAVGYFSSTATFGNTRLNSSGSTDIFIVKYDPNGNVLWAVKGGGSGYDIAWSIVTDKTGNIIVTGQFSVQATFESVIIQSSGYTDMFVVKYSSDGKLLWARKGGGEYWDSGEDIEIDNLDNIVVSGIYTISAIFDSISVPEAEAYNSFIAKYNPEGSIQWIQVIGGGIPFNVSNVLFADLRSNGITINNNGIFITGTFTDKVYFTKDTLVCQGEWDTYIARYGLDGTFNWAKQIKGGLVWTFDIKADKNGNLFLAGGFQENASFGNLILINTDSLKTFTPFLAKYNDQGIPIWAKQDSSYGWASHMALKGIDIITLIGTDFINSNIFIEQYDSNGKKIWKDLVGGLLMETPGGIIDDGSGSLIMSGGFSSTINFGDIELTSDGDSTDIFVCKFSPSSNIIVKGDTANLGQSIIINITPPLDFQYNFLQLFYRKIGESTYQQSTINTSGNLQSVTIPFDYSTIRGLQYYIVFSNGQNTVTYPKNNPASSPVSIPVKIAELTYPLKLKPSVYEMISIPISVSNSKLNSVFEDDYNSYNRSLWRIFRWDARSNGYLEYSNINSDLQPGNAFWLISSEGKSFDLENAFSVLSTNGFLITLQPGWNQVGNPFAFPVAWDSVKISMPTGDDSINSFGAVQIPIGWNPDTEEYELNQKILIPWKGYWIYDTLETSVTLSIPPIESSILPKKNLWDNLSEDEFILQIKARNQFMSHDNQNFIGMLRSGNNGIDRLDILEPPSITDKLKLSIIKNDKEYAQNIVPVSADGVYWDLKINSNSSDKNIILDFNKKSPLPKDFKIWFIDKNKLLSVPVLDDELILQVPKDGFGNYRVIIGKEDFAKQHSEQIPLVPFEYKLFQNYPNPFNSSTIIAYNLYEKSHVTIEVFDILGRKIKTLVNDEFQNPGTHNMHWDGTNSVGEYTSSGIYIYRLRANDFSDSKMMILLK